MKLNPYTLAFEGEHAYLEGAYRANAFQRNLPYFRFVHLASIFFIGMMIFIDITHYPAHTRTFVLIKVLGIFPMFLAGLPFTYWRQFEKWQPTQAVLFVAVVGAAFSAMVAMAAPGDGQPLFIGVLITLVFNYSFLRSRFVIATLAGWVVFLEWIGVLLLVGPELPFTVKYSTTFFVVTMNLLGMVIANTQERKDRRSFILWTTIQEERDSQAQLYDQLAESVAEIKLLKGILPTCAHCKNIRDASGDWRQIEAYIRDHSDAEFSHTICPDCMDKLYPGLGD